mmetsp:Transcript_16660/g.40843  ORF Transcript_16660/g.40843 Transcript_16660/m.40843 type:complete len:241 (+) Transcript_16660:1696-2418(+)
MGPGGERAEVRAGEERPRVEAQPGGRRVLRPQDRHYRAGRPQAPVPVRYGTAGLPAAHPLQPQLRHRAEPARAPRHHPPRHPRVRGAHVRHPHGALRRQVAVLAVAPAGDDRAHQRGVARLLPGGEEGAAPGGAPRAGGRDGPQDAEEGARGAAGAVELHPGGGRGREGQPHRQRAHARQRGARRAQAGGAHRGAERRAGEEEPDVHVRHRAQRGGGGGEGEGLEKPVLVGSGIRRDGKS